MEQKLAEFQRRHNKEIHFPQFAQLEKVKVTYVATSAKKLLQNFLNFSSNDHGIVPLSYEIALKRHLQRLMEIDREKQRKVISQCQRRNDKQQQIVLKQVKHNTLYCTFECFIKNNLFPLLHADTITTRQV